MIASAIIFGILVAQAAPDAVDLRATRKVGEKAEFKFELEATAGGQKLKMTGFRSEVIKSVAADGAYVKESTPYGEKTTLEGEDTRQAPGRPEKTSYDKNGRPAPGLLNLESDRRARLIALILPAQAVKTGDYWAADTESRDKLPAVRSAYQFKGTEKGFLRVDFMATEKDTSRPMEAVGAYLLDPKSKQVVRVEIQVKNAVLMGVPSDYTMKLIRQ